MSDRLLTSALSGRRALLVVAARLEAEAAARAFGVGPERAPAEWAPALRLDERLSLLTCGIGKANAAGATAAALATAAGEYSAVLNLGVCGSLPGPEGPLAPGAAVAASASAFADEGLLEPAGFKDVAEMGFGPLSDLPGGGVSIPGDRALRAALASISDREGVVATVSTCSGTDALAAEAQRRSGAIVEAMEGAAIGLVCARFGVAFAEWRVVSNTTGDRARQRWDIRGALERLRAGAARL